MTSGLPGWYPDPGGQAGLFRYWDGQTWSEALSPTPYAPPPTGGGASGAPGQGAYGRGSYSQAGAYNPGAPNQGSAYGSGAPNQSSAYGQGGYTGGQPGASGPYGPLGSGAPGQTGYGPGPAGQPPYGGGTTPLATGFAARTAAGATSTALRPARKRSVGRWLGLGAILVVVAVVIWQVITHLGPIGDGPTGGDPPINDPTTTACPPTSDPFQDSHPKDGRVHGGGLSFPELLSPWSGVSYDDRVPFGRDVSEQVIAVHANYSPGQNWVASILVGELYTGDGFYTPEEGSEIVTRCIVKTFYGDADVTRTDVRSEATTLQGHDAWLIETNLSFDIPNLPTKSEWVVIMIVATSDLSSSIFYASIPEDSPPEAFDGTQLAIENLTVD